MRCSRCHQNANFDPGRVPGSPHWHLAPSEMAWEGKTVGEICLQMKDPARNGGRSINDLIDHIGKDTLVGWAWGTWLRQVSRTRHAADRRGARRGVGEDRVSLSEAVIILARLRPSEAANVTALLAVQSMITLSGTFKACESCDQTRG